MKNSQTRRPLTRRRSRGCIAVSIAFALGLATGPVLAQSAALPDVPLRILVPTTPGSTPDLLARSIGPKFAERLARALVVENRIGASGAIGTEATVRAAPNGATLLIAASTLATGATLQAGLSYDAMRDLTPIVLMGWNRLVLVTHPKTGLRTAADLAAAARKAPGRLNYGSPGVGTPNHLAAELFKVRAGVFMTHIPYRGTAPQITDVLGGQLDMAPLTIIAAAPHVRAGKLVALGITGDKRAALLPGVPSLTEAGFKDVQGDIWYGLFAPRGLPAELVARLHAEMSQVLRAEEKSLADQGFEVELSTPEGLGQLLARDTARWAELIKKQGIRAE